MAITPTTRQFQNADKLVAASIKNLEAQAVLAATVQKQAAGQFDGTVGQAVAIRRPSMLVANQGRVDALKGDTSKITVTSLAETVLNIELDQHIYSAVALSDAELSLEIPDFAAQVAFPQADAVVDKLERLIVGQMETFKGFKDAKTGVPAAKSELDLSTGDEISKAQKIRFALAQAAAQLTGFNVPTSGRFAVLGAEAAGILMNDPNLTRVNEAGTGSALREAVIGKLYGFTLVQSNHIDPLAVYCYHPSAVQLVNRAPIVPPSVKVGSSQARDGYAIRWVRDYDASIAAERSFFSTFAGAKAVDDKVRDAKTGDVKAGGVVRGLKFSLKTANAGG
ncbi:P22 phage major capsid protein family protein [Streptomyces sp. NPDC004732]|uniref:P22 phage major capsid protein family protein n=1 Tax=Streptomyces sp. NPDC004732 TaxID=3154290 RepID=UPI0033AC960E